MTAGTADWNKGFEKGVELAASLPGAAVSSVPVAVEGPKPAAAKDALFEFGYLPLVQLFESSRNPRKHFDPAALAELTESVRQSGVLEPLVVRPAAKGRYEIGAGSRRYRAAKAAGLATVPCRIRAMDDGTFLELLTVSNLQRADIHPLEEAEGYKDLLTLKGYDVARIAGRVGRSVKYVYDRMKLLQLTKPAKALFFEGKMTAGHAILLARLPAKDQARAIDSDRSGNGHIGGLFVPDFGDEGLGLEEDDQQKPVSVREFDKWIADNVRFTREAADPMLFPETAEDLVRHLAYLVLVQELRDSWRAPREFPKRAKAFGVDVEKILDAVAPQAAKSDVTQSGTKKPAKAANK